MAYIETGINAKGRKVNKRFVISVFMEIIKHYHIEIEPKGVGTYTIKNSPFQGSQIFSDTPGREWTDILNIEGRDLYIYNVWWNEPCPQKQTVENLKKYVETLTRNKYLIEDRSTTPGEHDYHLMMDDSMSSVTEFDSLASVELSPIASLLNANGNIILTGAPGTGKTFMARKKIAIEIAGDENRIEFVQFHPSYDYTDFVEGLRPTPPVGGTIGFERKDGLFKTFCEKALNDPEHNYVFIIDEINRGEMSKVFGELFFSIDPGYRGESGAVRTQYANMVSSPNAFDKVLGKTDPKDYGYFFVPENVYIIGTMNDIDRSVDSMDFAMRRRFLIKDIKAEDTQKDMLTDETVIAKMDALNNVIEGKPEKKIKAKLGSSYSLGASYFQKYYKYNDFDKLWKYHLEGILREYLRGTQDTEGDLKILKEVYEDA